MASDNKKTKEELIAELVELRKMVAVAEDSGIGPSLFRDLMDQSADILAIADPVSGRLLDANQRMSELLGYSKAELLAMTIPDFDCLINDKAAWDHFVGDLRKKGSISLESILKRKDGTEFPVEVNVRLTVERQKEFLVVVSRDITRNRRASEDLKSERVFIEAALDASTDTFFVFDVTTGKPVRWNRVFREVSGYSDDEIGGMTAPTDFYDPEDLAIAEEAINSLPGKAFAMAELPLLTKDGRKIPYEYSVTMIELADAVTTLACSVGRDVTERKQVEEVLRLSESKHRGVLESLNVGVVAHAPDTKILYWNKMALQLLGLTDDQMLGISGFGPQWNFLHESGSIMAIEDYPVNLSLRTQTNIHGYVVGVVRPGSNDVIWAICNTHRVLDEKGDMEHLLVSFLDFTGLKLAAEEHQSLQAQIQHSQKLESLGVLAGGIAHDFNNLLMTIIGNTDHVLQDLSPDAAMAPHVQAIEGASRRASILVKQMLAYSGRGHFIVAPLDLNDTLVEMAHLLESSISKKVELKIDLEPDLSAIHADSAQIQQVIMNLITNASEAFGTGETGIISVSSGVMECSKDYLAGSYLDEKQEAGKYVFLEVRDTGSGMDEKTIASLFDPFFTTKFTGRGLGLAAVLGIVRGHNGAIMVDSKLGEGTVFRVLFPVLGGDVKVRPIQERVPTHENWQGKGLVLVVDDEDPVRSIVVKSVKRLGFETLEAADGKMAIEVFREHADSIACVLLDLTMPRMDGGETCLAIHKIRDNVPIVLTSGFEESELLARFDGYGMAGFLQKPYKFAKLRDVLQQVLAD